MDRSSYSASESELLQRKVKDEDEWTGKATREVDAPMEAQLKDFSQVTGISDRSVLLALLQAANFDLQTAVQSFLGDAASPPTRGGSIPLVKTPSQDKASRHKDLTHLDQAPPKLPMPHPAMWPVLKNDIMLRAARGETTERAPVWLMRQAGRYLPEFRAMRAEHDFFKVCRNPELACEITLQPIRRFPKLDAAIIFSDILVIPQALGLDVVMVPGKGPSLPVTLANPEEIEDKLDLEVDVAQELQYVANAITLTRIKLEGKVPLIGFCGAPWTLMAYMIEGGGSKNWHRAISWFYRWPKQSHNLMQIITDALITFLDLQARAGAQLLQVFDSWASELPVNLFREFSAPQLARIATSLKRLHPTVPLILFAKGANHSFDLLTQAPYDVYGLDWTADVSVARQQTKGKSLQGNLHPVTLFAGKEVIRTQVKNMITQFGSQAYIANLGHGLLPDHSPEAVGDFIDAVHEFSATGAGAP